MGLRNEVTDFYDMCSGKTAPESLDRLIKKMRESEIEELITFSKTLNNWERFQNLCMLVLEKRVDFEIDRENGSVRMITKKEPDS